MIIGVFFGFLIDPLPCLLKYSSELSYSGVHLTTEQDTSIYLSYDPSQTSERSSLPQVFTIMVSIDLLVNSIYLSYDPLQTSERSSLPQVFDTFPWSIGVSDYTDSLVL
jgi:hypothetical protein